MTVTTTKSEKIVGIVKKVPATSSISCVGCCFVVVGRKGKVKAECTKPHSFTCEKGFIFEIESFGENSFTASAVGRAMKENPFTTIKDAFETIEAEGLEEPFGLLDEALASAINTEEKECFPVPKKTCARLCRYCISNGRFHSCTNHSSSCYGLIFGWFHPICANVDEKKEESGA